MRTVKKLLVLVLFVYISLI